MASIRSNLTSLRDSFMGLSEQGGGGYEEFPNLVASIRSNLTSRRGSFTGLNDGDENRLAFQRHLAPNAVDALLSFANLDEESKRLVTELIEANEKLRLLKAYVLKLAQDSEMERFNAHMPHLLWREGEVVDLRAHAIHRMIHQATSSMCYSDFESASEIQRLDCALSALESDRYMT